MPSRPAASYRREIQELTAQLADALAKAQAVGPLKRERDELESRLLAIVQVEVWEPPESDANVVIQYRVNRNHLRFYKRDKMDTIYKEAIRQLVEKAARHGIKLLP